MKKIGRGASYRKALDNNLIKNLLIHKKIRTTRTRGKRISDILSSDKNTKISIIQTENRRGDNAPTVEIEIIDPVKKVSKKETKKK